MEPSRPYPRVGHEDRIRYGRILVQAARGGYLDEEELKRLEQVEQARTLNVLISQVADLPGNDRLEGRRFLSALRDFNPGEHPPWVYVAGITGSAVTGSLPAAVLATAGVSGTVWAVVSVWISDTETPEERRETCRAMRRPLISRRSAGSGNEDGCGGALRPGSSGLPCSLPVA